MKKLILTSYGGLTAPIVVNALKVEIINIGAWRMPGGDLSFEI